MRVVLEQVWDEEDAKAERRREQQKKLAEEERRKLAEAAMEVRCARAMAENDVLTLQESAEPLEPSPGKRRCCPLMSLGWAPCLTPKWIA